MRGSNTFAAFTHREFRLLFASMLATNAGVWMQQFALGWLVVELAVREGHPELAGMYVGVRSLAAAIPGLVLGLAAGVYADRMDRRDLLVRTRVLSALVSLALAGLVFTDRVHMVPVMILSAAAAATFSFDPPARQAMLPSIVAPSALFSAIGLTRATMQAASMVGPLVGGLLLVPVGMAGVMLVQCALFLTSALILQPMSAQPTEDTTELGILGSAREGLAYAWSERTARWCVGLQAAFALFGQSLTYVLPAVAFDLLHVGPLELSWLMGAAGLGAVLGAVTIGAAGRVRRHDMLLLAALVATGSMVALVGLQRELVAVMALLAILGVAQQLFMGTESVMLQLASPSGLRGRMMALQSTVFLSIGPLGGLVIGTLSSLLGVTPALLFAGGATWLAVAVGHRAHGLVTNRPVPLGAARVSTE